MPAKKKNPAFDNYKPSKEEIRESIDDMRGNINSILDQLETPIEDMLPDSNFLPSVDMNREAHDYEKDVQLIKIEAKETLECLSNLYLDEETIKKKNIYKIIKDDSEKLSELNFSISCAKRALISCMTQLDMGVNDPLMYQSVAMFQKEMRETINMAYNIQCKMKEFYKGLKDEVPEINVGEKSDTIQANNLTIIGDPRMLNDVFDQYKKDFTLLNGSGFTYA